MTRRMAAVLLDRDGTINVMAPSEDDYITRPEDLVLLPGAAAAIGILNAAGIPVAVITNQRGIARGRMTKGDLDTVHARLDALLAAQGARVDAYYVCPHDRDTCDCRKPAPGLVLRAAQDLGRPTAEIVVIGDRQSDVEAGRAAGAQTLGIGDHVCNTGDDWAPDLLAAVCLLLGPAQLDDK
jgi:D-glycero-D-manno-heptose 1,7-bisphosphate phosphatase